MLPNTSVASHTLLLLLLLIWQMTYSRNSYSYDQKQATELHRDFSTLPQNSDICRNIFEVPFKIKSFADHVYPGNLYSTTITRDVTCSFFMTRKLKKTHSISYIFYRCRPFTLSLIINTISQKLVIIQDIRFPATQHKIFWLKFRHYYAPLPLHKGPCEKT